MKFWFSGEVQADVVDAYRVARQEVEAALNESLGEVDYGDQLREWNFIAIIKERDDPDWGEVARYHNRDKSLEFRLRIDHARFKAASALACRRMVMEAVLRSVCEARAIAPKDVRLDRIEHDTLRVAREKNWLFGN